MRLVCLLRIAWINTFQRRHYDYLHRNRRHPLLVGGGSDHMQKIGSLRSVNPYNPFLAMWTMITRRAKWYEGRLHPEEALSRQTGRFHRPRPRSVDLPGGRHQRYARATDLHRRQIGLPGASEPRSL